MGSICAQVKAVERDFIECEIQNDGCIYENSQVTMGGGLALTSGSEADLAEMQLREELLARDVRFCLENDVDYIIHSIYHGKQEILDLKKIIIDENEKMMRESHYMNEVKIIAKLEKEEAIKDI